MDNADYSTVLFTADADKAYDNFMLIYEPLFEKSCHVKYVKVHRKYIKREPWIISGIFTSSILKEKLNRRNAQTVTPVPRTKVAVHRRSSSRPNIVSFTGVSVGQVVFLSFWCVVKSCRRCGTVIGAMLQGHMYVTPMCSVVCKWCLSVQCPVLRCTIITWSSLDSW